jgi:hypothetical protein
MIYFGILFDLFLLFYLFKYLQRTANLKRAVIYYVVAHFLFSFLFNIFYLSFVVMQILAIWIAIDIVFGFLLLWLIKRFAGNLITPILLIVFGMFFRFGLGAYIALT